MAQHDFVIDNGPGLAVRTDINAAIQALVSQSSGPVEPTTKYPGMLWLDTSVTPNGLLRQRNQGNDAWIAPQSATSVVLTAFAASGTYTKPAGLRYLEVACYGGGGAGGGAPATAASQGSGGTGGNGGAKSYSILNAGDIAATVAMTVGAGGAGVVGAAGGAGGDTTFGSHVNAKGGAGGVVGGPVGAVVAMLPAPAAQISTAGMIRGATYPGGPLFVASSGTWQMGGQGGAGEIGGGGQGLNGTTGASPGNAAVGNAGGGGGAIAGPSATARAGGAGLQGFVLIKEYF